MTTQTQTQTLANHILTLVPDSLPAPRKSAVAIKRLEHTLTPYPAFFRELQSSVIEDIRATHPEHADELEAAFDSATQAIETHIAGLRSIAQLLNNH
ncbi:hypothetical protein E2J97_17100 [Vibrio cholerae]|uniref:hypothetical protein n=1 Tax=Vibrio cholerae TaxID=666 RepID=UPI000E4B1059|nr:hypothetical protein [Vibrio cholerae]EGR0666970.1 hypothetical protein [Vibrio cholerae]MDV2340928.1 hypothetical protein [Vibrio cholerae]RGP86569.1 hypothetical protein BC354_13300 [Vibrio cholerae]RGP94333.1 hypothetical protein BC352_12955 [Vibrio cholerae]TQP68467.1 hypothetical protein FLL76_00550 [Vibrio cholerae]